MELQEQGAHGDEAGNGEDTDGSGSFLFDVDLTLGEMVEYGQCLQAALVLLGQPVLPYQLWTHRGYGHPSRK